MELGVRRRESSICAVGRRRDEGTKGPHRQESSEPRKPLTPSE